MRTLGGSSQPKEATSPAYHTTRPTTSTTSTLSWDLARSQSIASCWTNRPASSPATNNSSMGRFTRRGSLDHQLLRPPGERLRPDSRQHNLVPDGQLRELRQRPCKSGRNAMIPTSSPPSNKTGTSPGLMSRWPWSPSSRTSRSPSSPSRSTPRRRPPRRACMRAPRRTLRTTARSYATSSACSRNAELDGLDLSGRRGTGRVRLRYGG
ncbi:hypothetical protein B0H13DRAFT_1077541 [Mycena leptocephala]|nr:hypothetical protein B0H13DRAFT_1077541 [Mycena leptocephala]